jgi:hypothetical protein
MVKPLAFLPFDLESGVRRLNATISTLNGYWRQETVFRWKKGEWMPASCLSDEKGNIVFKVYHEDFLDEGEAGYPFKIGKPLVGESISASYSQLRERQKAKKKDGNAPTP